MEPDNERLLSKSIANKIKHKIIKGELAINEQIPNEQTLAEQLMVSRSTIREAVKILVSKNVLQIERGKGTFVVNTPGLVEDPLGFEFIQDDILVKHLCEYRLAIEPNACAIAAEKASKEQIQEMHELIRRMEATGKRLVKAKDKDNILDQVADMDAEFHSLVYHMTQNTVFSRLIPIINNTVIENYTTLLYRKGDQKLPFADAHKALFRAIRAGDTELAFKLSKEHMEIMQAELFLQIDLRNKNEAAAAVL